MELLTARAVRKSYGPVLVLKGIDIDVADGETLAVIGPNGAGKTTLFRSLTGEVPIDSGTIVYDGDDVTKLPDYQRVRRGFGRTFQVARVFADLTTRENMLVALEARHASRDAPAPWWRITPRPEVEREVQERLADLGLWERREAYARELSHGDKKRLELALTLALEPRLLMLDEPTAGMSPGDRIAAVELIRRIRTERKIALVLTEHDMEVVFGLADRLVVLNYGEVVAQGLPEAVRADPRVREIYLGSAAAHA